MDKSWLLGVWVGCGFLVDLSHARAQAILAQAVPGGTPQNVVEMVNGLSNTAGYIALAGVLYFLNQSQRKAYDELLTQIREDNRKKDEDHRSELIATRAVKMKLVEALIARQAIDPKELA